MLDPKFFDDLANRLAGFIPPSLHHLRDDLEKNFRSVLQSCFTKLDLVTREEFDAQVKVLQKTRERVIQLEQKLRELEGHPHSTSSNKPEEEK